MLAELWGRASSNSSPHTKLCEMPTIQGTIQSTIDGRPTHRKNNDFASLYSHWNRFCWSFYDAKFTETQTAVKIIHGFNCLFHNKGHTIGANIRFIQFCTAALRRFCVRRGAPARMYSDTGLNFVGTKNELRQHQMNLTKKFGKESMLYAADKIGISWAMIPPGESGVNLAKSHLRRVMGNNVLTYEELSSLLCDNEAILNS